MSELIQSLSDYLSITTIDEKINVFCDTQSYVMDEIPQFFDTAKLAVEFDEIDLLFADNVILPLENDEKPDMSDIHAMANEYYSELLKLIEASTL